jgi:iron complex outermembrane receptor protein
LKILFTWLAITFSVVALAQVNTCTLVLSGRVIDDHDETPLSFSQVILVGTERGAVADEDGRFTLTNLCAGTHQLEIRHVGCESVVRSVKLTSKQNEVVVRMEHHHELHEVEIAANAGQKQAHPTTESMDSEALNLQRTEGFSGTLSKLNGVSLLKSGPNVSKPIIQGLYGNRIAIYNDRARLEDQQWGADHAPAINLAGAGSLILVKGAQGVEYGPEAIGGAVVMEPAAFGTNRSPHGTMQLAGFSNGRGGQIGAGVSGALLKNNRFGYQIAGSMLKSGDRNAPDYVLSNTGNEDYSANASFGYQYKTLKVRLTHSLTYQQNGILRSAHNGNLTDLQNAISLTEPRIIRDFSYDIYNPRQEVWHNSTQLNAEVKPGLMSKMEFGYAYQQNQRKEFDIRRGERYEIPALDLRLRAHNGYLRFTRVVGNNFSFKAGADAKFIDNLSNPETGTRPIVPNYKQLSLGAFTRLSYQFGKWQSELGLRYDHTSLIAYKWYRFSDWENLYQDDFGQFVMSYNDAGTQVFVQPELNYNNYSAALGLSKKSNDQNIYGLRFTLAGRAPNSAELFSDGLHHGAAMIERGSLNLKTEHAYSAEVYGSLEISKLSAVANFYAKYFDGYIQPEISGVELTTRGAFPAMTYAQTNAIFYGFDLSLNYQLTQNLSLNSANSLTMATDLSRNAYLLNIPPFQSTNELEWKKEQKGKKITPVFALGVISRLKQYRAPQVISIDELMNLSENEISEARSNGAFDIISPPGEYHLVFARLQADIQWGTRTFQTALVANNLLNRKYRDYLNRFRYFSDDEGINISLLLTLKF